MVVAQGEVWWADLPEPVANVSQIVTLDRALLTERVGRLSRRHIELVLAGIKLILRN